MTTLYPTKTRLALLQAVADGDVRQCYPLLPDPVYAELDLGGVAGPRYRKVTSRIERLRRAGWVELGGYVFPGASQAHSPRRWVLTDAGQAILESAS